MLVDSGISAHMTAPFKKFTLYELCYVNISLCNNAKIRSHQNGIWKVRWKALDEKLTICLSENLVLKKLDIFILSVPALVDEIIASLFPTGEALSVNLQGNMKVLGAAAKAKDGPSCVFDRQDLVLKIPKANAYVLKATMPIKKEHAQSQGG